MAGDELPSYPQMIIEAIDALKQPGGADKSAISEFIESSYEDLPADHADLLTTHLSKLKDSGELLLNDNNYLKAGGAAPKRGRGRPPKAKDPLASAATAPSGPPRPRGRPPSNAPPAAASAAKKAKTSEVGSTGRPRGRPRKVKPQQHVEAGVEA